MRGEWRNKTKVTQVTLTFFMMWKFVKWSINGRSLDKAMNGNGAWMVFTLILKLNMHIMVYQHHPMHIYGVNN